ncbi:M50 family metallopeptidase [Cellulomonas sp. ATA003]|uniref:M50 family metallopeptidase n=1 Tax=Cellulomonas sp. ATA003 TaxID=3073064 RepID=UPI00287397EF|nr:M50 family metallopeptidase [Cellulomonas sp. ATA003]WNB85368.1 M50 family metallopeptidase [Cellulomonas sp. ATA003]
MPVDLLVDIWGRATSTHPAPSSATVWATAAVAAVAVGWRPVWRVVRHAVTLVHEAGHAGVAVLTGRRLAGIRLHSDTSGLTTSVGRPRGPGMVATAAAGYLAPAGLGLLAAWATAHGRGVGLLWGLLGVVVVLAVGVRNLFGLWSVLVTAAALVVVTWWVPPVGQTAVACAVSWLLLLGAPRTVVELARTRRRGARTSDADALARLTHVPAALWVAAFGIVTVGAAALGGSVLAPGLLGGVVG